MTVVFGLATYRLLSVRDMSPRAILIPFLPVGFEENPAGEYYDLSA